MLPVVIATSRTWGEAQIERLQHLIAREVILIQDKSELAELRLKEISPQYVFFPHWSYIIPPEIYENYECVIFHMTDVPFGRGGSPLQNLIARGIYETKISAIKCVKELDAGPVYSKTPLSLNGNAEEIYQRAYGVIEEMIADIVLTQPVPAEQTGEIVEFKRRSPEDGNVFSLDSLDKVYDYIRMLDAEGYPRAFLESDKMRFEFEQATLKDGQVYANVKISRKAHE